MKEFQENTRLAEAVQRAVVLAETLELMGVHPSRLMVDMLTPAMMPVLPAAGLVLLIVGDNLVGIIAMEVFTDEKEASAAADAMGKIWACMAEQGPEEALDDPNSYVSQVIDKILCKIDMPDLMPGDSMMSLLKHIAKMGVIERNENEEFRYLAAREYRTFVSPSKLRENMEEMRRVTDDDEVN